MDKNLQLQVRVSRDQKRRIKDLAAKAGMGMSEWVLFNLFSPLKDKYASLLQQLTSFPDRKYVFATINDFLARLTPVEFDQVTSVRAPFSLRLYDLNYLAAIIECAAHKKGVSSPAWLQEIKPLGRPFFGTSLMSLRLYLLTHAPIPFRRRNIFIDATVGDRV